MSILPSNQYLQVCPFFKYCIFCLTPTSPKPGKQCYSQLASITPDTNLWKYIVLRKLHQRTAVADPVLCREVEFSTITWSLTDHEKIRHTSGKKYAFEHESNTATHVEESVPYLTEAKFLDFIHFWMNFEKTQCHERHNDSVYGTRFTLM